MKRRICLHIFVEYRFFTSFKMTNYNIEKLVNVQKYEEEIIDCIVGHDGMHSLP